jgi:hypothetical protein
MGTMSLDDFCVGLSKLDLTQPQRAIAIVWFLDKAEAGASRTPGDLSRIMRDIGLGATHSTKLGESMVASTLVLRKGDRLSLKPTARTTVEQWVSSLLVPEPPKVDQDNGYVPEAVWQGTRGYITKITQQINGCYQFGFYDGAAVLVRRILETLLIECYINGGIENKIKQTDGNYVQLGEIITGAVDRSELSLGRETKHVLKDIKKSGDRSAHIRTYIACKADLDRIQAGVRVAVQDLLHLSGLK